MKPYIAHFLTPVQETSGESLLNDHETRSLEDTRPDDVITSRKVTIETSTIEKTEPDDLFFSKQTFTKQDSEPDELYSQKQTTTESLEDSLPDDNYY